MTFGALLQMGLLSRVLGCALPPDSAPWRKDQQRIQAEIEEGRTTTVTLDHLKNALTIE